MGHLGSRSVYKYTHNWATLRRQNAHPSLEKDGGAWFTKLQKGFMIKYKHIYILCTYIVLLKFKLNQPRFRPSGLFGNRHSPVPALDALILFPLFFALT